MSMLRKLVHITKQMLGLDSELQSFPQETKNPTMQSPQNFPYHQQIADYQIPPDLNPYINPHADWEYYRQLVASQQFVQQQNQQLTQQYQQQAMYSQCLDNLRSLRSEYQSQQIANGADPEYYAKLNQAYQRGIDSLQRKSSNQK